MNDGLARCATQFAGRRLAPALQRAGFTVIEVRCCDRERPHAVPPEKLGEHIGQVPPAIIASELRLRNGQLRSTEPEGVAIGKRLH